MRIGCCWPPAHARRVRRRRREAVVAGPRCCAVASRTVARMVMSCIQVRLSMDHMIPGRDYACRAAAVRFSLVEDLIHTLGNSYADE